MRHLVRSAALAALCGLGGCVGAPVGPYGYAQPAYPAPAAYAPVQPPPSQVAYGGRCYAGIYTCDLAQALPVGSQCACPGLGAPSYGAVR